MPTMGLSYYLFKIRRFLVYFVIIIVLYFIKYAEKNYILDVLSTYNQEQLNYNANLINFEDFNNNTGLGPHEDYIVPNIIHYVHLNQANIKFPLFLSILSAWLNQKPAYIYFHCNDCNYQGKYWDELNRIVELQSIIKIKPILNFDERIFTAKPGWIHHKSDVVRLLALMQYGGIYLDNDMLVINSLDKYRKFEVVTSWDSDQDGIGNQIFIANKNARFLRAIYDNGYR